MKRSTPPPASLLTSDSKRHHPDSSAAAAAAIMTSPASFLVQRISQHAQLPTRGSALAAGYDLYSLS